MSPFATLRLFTLACLVVLLDCGGHVTPPLSPGTRVGRLAVEEDVHELVAMGHQRRISHLAPSNDGTWLWSADEAGVVKGWSTDPLRELVQLDAGEEFPQLSATPDGSRVAVATSSGVRIFSRAGELVHELPAEEARGFAGFDARGARMVTVQPSLRIWDTAGFTPIATLGGPGSKVTRAFFVGEDRLAEETEDGNLAILDVHTGARLGDLQTAKRTGELSWSSDGAVLAMAEADSVDLAAPATSDPLRHISVPGSVEDVSVSGDGKVALVVSSTDQGLTRFSIDVATATIRSRSAARDELSADLVTLSADGARAWSASSLDHVWLCQSSTLGDDRVCREFPGAVRSLRASRDGGTLVVGCENGTALVWDMRATQRLRRIGGDLVAGDVALALGDKVFAQSASDRLRLVRVSTGGIGEMARQEKGASLRGAAASADGKWLGTVRARVAAPKHVTYDALFVNAATRAITEVRDVRVDGVAKEVALSDDGSLMAIELGDEIVKVSLARRAVVARTPSKAPIGHVRFVPKTDQIAFSTDMGVTIQRSTGEPLVISIPHVVGIGFVDPRRLAIGARDGVTRIADALTGRVEIELHGGRGVDFAPLSPGKLAIADADLHVRIWDLASATLSADLVALGSDWYVRDAAGRFESATSAMPPEVYPVHHGVLEPIEPWASRHRSSQVLEGALGWPVAPTSAAAPQMSFQTGHRGEIRTLAFSPDGALLASGGYVDSLVPGGELIVWDVRSGVQLRSLPNGATTDALFSPDGALLVSSHRAAAYGDPSLRAWDWRSGRVVSAFGYGPDRRRDSSGASPLGFESATALALFGTNPSGAPETGRVDARTGAWLGASRPLPADFRPLAATPDGRVLVGRNEGGYYGETVPPIVNVLAKGDSKPRELRGHASAIVALAVSPDGTQIASGDANGFVMLWDGASGARKALLRPRPFEPDAISAVGFSRDGQSLVVAATEQVLLYDTRSPAASPRTLAKKQQVKVLAFSPDGKSVALAGWQTKAAQYVQTAKYDITLVDLATGAETRTLGTPADPIERFALSPADPRLSFLTGHHVRTWDPREGREGRAMVVPSERLFGGDTDDGAITAFAWSRDGKSVALGGYDRIRVIEPATGRIVWERKEKGPHQRLSFAGGKLLSFWRGEVKDELPVQVAVLDPSSGAPARVLTAQAGYLVAAEPNPDGSLVVVATEPESRGTDVRRPIVEIWDTATGTLASTLALGALGEFTGVADACFVSPSEVAVAARSPNVALVYDARSGALERTLDGLGSAPTALACDPVRHLVVSGDSNGEVLVWDAQSGLELRKLGTLDGTEVRQVALAYDGKRIAALGRNGLLRFFDAERGGEIGTFVSANEAAFAFGARSGAYDASEGARSTIAFRVGDRAYPFEQYDARFNRPDEALAALGYAAPDTIALFAAARAKRLAHLGLSGASAMTDDALPTLSLVGAPPVSAQATRRVVFRVRASSDKRNVSKLIAYDNDVPLFGAAGMGLGAGGRDLEQEISLELSAGRNKIQVAAVDDRGLESLRTTFDVTYTGPPLQPDLYVIAVGVSKYKDSRFDLTYPSKDAADIAAAFGASAKAYGNVHSHVLTDDKATRESILAVREELSRAKVDDTVIVFFAGHGLLDRDHDYYFGTPDIDPKSPATRGISYDQIEGLLDGIPPRKKLLLMDTCHAGEVDPDELRAATPKKGVKVRDLPSTAASPSTPEKRPFASLGLVRELFAELRRGSGAHVLAAASGAELSFEDPEYKNGIFTYSILKALKNRAADRDKDGAVTVSELRQFVSESVRTLTSGLQSPNARRENLEADFDVTPDAARTAPAADAGCPGVPSPDGSTSYDCGALKVGTFRKDGTRSALLEAAVALVVGKPSPNLTVERTAGTLADKGRTPTVVLTSRLKDTREPIVWSELVVLPDEVGKLRAVVCVAQLALPAAVARCERSLLGFDHVAAPVWLP